MLVSSKNTCRATSGLMFDQTTRHCSLAQLTPTINKGLQRSNKGRKGLGEESKLCMNEKFTLMFQFWVRARVERAGRNHPKEPPGKFLQEERLWWDRTPWVLPWLSSNHRRLLLGARGHTGTRQHASSVPGSKRSLGGGNGNPLQYSCLENPMDREEPGGLQRVRHD